MRRSSLLLTFTLILCGCGRSSVPSGKYFSGEPAEHWLQAIKDADPKRRKKAADVLGNIGPADSRAIPALIEAAKDEDANVRDAAVLGLSKIGPPALSAESVLTEAANDKDAAVRSHAAAALDRVRGVK